MNDHTIVRVHKGRENPYSMICNHSLRNPSLSLQAKGLLAYLLSLPDNWKIHLREVMTHSKNGRDSHYTALNELIENGYIIRAQKRDEKGRATGIEYRVYEIPFKDLLLEKQELLPLPGKADAVTQESENLPLLKTNLDKELKGKKDSPNARARDGSTSDPGGSQSPSESKSIEKKERTPSNSKDASPKVPMSEMVDLWNQMASKTGMHKVRKFSPTDPRKKALQDCFKELDHNIDNWKGFLVKVSQAPYLRGENNKGWKADLEFVTRPEKFIKICEGAYDLKKHSALQELDEMTGWDD